MISLPKLRLVCLFLFLCPALFAQATLTWGNGTGTWDTTTANWGGSVWTEGSNATIGTTGARTGTVTIQGGGVTVNNVTSGSGGGAAYVHTLTGGPIALAGPASTWTIGGPAGSQLLVDSIISGHGSLEKLGTRLLILAGNNTYAGDTIITAGQLQIGNGGTSGSVAGNIIANNSLTFNRSDTHAYGGVISGTSAITHAGSGTLVLTGDSVTTANLTVAAGTLQLGAGGTTGSYAGSIVNNGAVVFNRSGTLAYGRTLSGTGTVTIGGSGTVLLNGTNTYTGATTVNAGATLGGSGSLASAVTVAGGGTLRGQTGQVFATGDLTLSAGSSLDVSLGAASTTGLFLVNGSLTLDGTLNITDAGGFGPGLYRIIDYTGTLTDNGLVLGLTGGAGASDLAIQTATPNEVNLFFDAGSPNLWRGGAGVWSADAGGSGWTDILGVVDAPWQPQFAIFTGTPGAVTVDDGAGAVELTGAQFAVDGYTIAGDALTNNTAGAVFRVGNGTGAGAAMTATISAPIIGTGGLDKTDLGTLVLTGANTYAGVTTVTNGTLQIDGDQSGAAGATTVRAGATLAGAGTLGGSVIVENGGTLAGRSGQTFTMGSLALGPTSHLNVALGAPSATGLFHVNGDLTLDGTLNVTDAGAFGPGVYRLIDYTGALTNHGLAFGTTPVGTQFLAVQTALANQVNLIFDAGPRNFWQGGSGPWTADPAGTAWTDFTGSAASAWQPDFAIFQNAPGVVTIDTTAGAVVATGAQFAVDGYTVGGDTLTNNTAGAIFRVGDGTTAGAAMTATISASITGTGGLDKTDLGTLILSGANTYAGTTTVTNGTLRIDDNQSGATGTTTVLTGATLTGTGTLGGAVTVEDGGTLAGQSGQTFTMGALSLGASAQLNVALAAPSTTSLFQVNGDLTLDGTLNVTDAGAFGPGVYRLIDYTGALTDNGLALGSVPVSPEFLAVQTSVAHQVNFVFNAGASNFWTGGSGLWTANPAGPAWTDFGGFTASAWQPQFAIFQGTPGTVTVDTGTGAVVATGAQFAVDGYTVTGDSLTTNTAGSIFRVGDGTTAGAAMTATISAPIIGTGGIDKTDLGTLVLTGDNTYAGTTTVTNGTLRLDGNQSGATGDTTVLTGATLAGAGMLGGAVTVENGGTLAGRSGQIFTMGALSLGPTSQLNVALGAPSATGLFQVNGDLTLDGTLNVTDTGGFGPGLYRIINYTGTLTNNGLALGSTAGVNADSFSILTSTARQVSLLYSDLDTPLPLWTGGSGTWTANPAGTGFANADGSISAGWRPGFALFQGTPGTVTVDSSAGAVVVTGLQFASDGYVITGGEITNDTANATFRVGDGTSAGAGMTATLNAPITGAGGIDKTDLGTLILGGGNTYAGATSIHGGVLQISSDGNLGSAGAGLVLNGGTLRTTAGTVSARGVMLNPAGGTFDTGAHTLALAGAITGSGGLTKTGSGQLVLSGANTYTGTTTISAGSVMLQNSSVGTTTVAANGTLAGNGTVRGNLNNSGHVSPGASPGTLTINGNYIQTATGSYTAELASASSHDRLAITGSASLGGTLVVTGLNGFVPQAGQSFTLLTAAGGVTGTFSTVSSPWDQLSAMLRPQTVYAANDVRFVLAQRAFASLAGTSNQQALGVAVDGTILVNSAPAVVAALNALPTDSVVLASLDELSPQRYERWFEQAVSHAGASVRSAERRLAGVELAARPTLWMELVRRETRFDASGESRASEGTANGILVGGDLAVTSDLRLGLVFAYTDETLDLDRAGSTTESPRYGFDVYARKQAGSLFFDAVGGFSRAELTSRRTVALPGFSGVATGVTDSFESHLSLRMGYAKQMGGARVTPYAGVQFVRWQANSFDETGAGSASLALLGQSGESLASRLGLIVSGSFSLGGATLAPQLDLAWRKEFQDDAREIAGALGGTSFAIRSRGPKSGGLIVGLGLDARLGDRFSAYGRLGLERDGAADEAIEGRAGLTYRF